MDAHVAAWSHGLAALVYGALAVAAYRHRTRHLDAPPIILPAALSALWATLASLQAGGLTTALLTHPAELARNAAWFWFLTHSLRQLKPDTPLSPWLRYVNVSLASLVAADLALLGWALLSASATAAFMAMAVVPALLAVAGMALVEQFYRNARTQDRWGIKFLCLALGGMFAYDFYLYSEAMLLRAVSLDAWAARGAVNALLVPMLWLSVRRTSAFLPVSISHRMVFHTVTLAATGIYLLLMAAAGYYIRLMGGQWGQVLQYVFLFGAGVLLMVVAFSGAARAQVRVFLSKHFFRYRYDYRDEWLRFTHQLTAGEPGVRLCERSIEAIGRLVESPAGALWLQREDEPFKPVAHWNWSDLTGTLPADAPMAHYMQRHQDVINLQELSRDPALREQAQLPAWIEDNARIWLVIPMLWHDRLLGFILLAHSLGKVHVDWEVSDLLKTAARQASTNLAQMQAADALTVARQFESFNRAAAFVVHDIKNLVAQLSLLLANAEKHRHKQEFQEDMLATIDSSVARMNRMLLKLREQSSAGGDGLVDLEGMLNEVVASKQAFSLKPDLRIETPGIQVRADRERLTRIVGHLLQNAIEATPYTGHVGVKLWADSHHACILVEDTGTGMDEAFIRDHLFRPFVSTKGTGMGVGAYECKEYVQELKGDITVESTPGRGSRFTIRLPLAAGELSGVMARAEGEI